MSKLPTVNKRPTDDNGGSLQQFLRSRERMVWQSTSSLFKDGQGSRDIGRNKAKRARTGARKTWRRA